MKSLAPYLDELKKLKRLKTDVEVSAVLGVTKQHVSQIRSGKDMGEEKCFQLAKLLGREPLELLSLNRALRMDSRPVRDYWLKLHAECRKAKP